jgi:Lipopolysaccharide-assembly
MLPWHVARENSALAVRHAAGVRPTWLGLLLFVLCLSGCAGYRFGNQSLYPSDIQTVYVPVFESNSFRRYLGERLTEAVQKEIELKTPYKVVGSPQADSILTGRIINDTKKVIVEDTNDQPRETEFNLVVQVSWVDRKGDLVGNPNQLAVPAAVAELVQHGKLIPEYGQSTTTAQQVAIQKLAEQIVQLMELPPF